jgi:hypothetical protein
MFQQPSAAGDKIPVPELVGSLVLIYVREYRTGIVTSFGEKDAIACDVHVLDGPKSGEVFDSALLFQGALIGSLRAAVGGDPVLARIGQGVAKPNQSPPYVLNPFTAADAAIATAYIQQMPKPFQAAPPASAPAAAHNGAPQVPAPAAAPAPAAVPAVDYASLPPEVQELLRQSGAMPR